MSCLNVIKKRANVTPEIEKIFGRTEADVTPEIEKIFGRTRRAHSAHVCQLSPACAMVHRNGAGFLP